MSVMIMMSEKFPEQEQPDETLFYYGDELPIDYRVPSMEQQKPTGKKEAEFSNIEEVIPQPSHEVPISALKLEFSSPNQERRAHPRPETPAHKATFRSHEE